MPHSSSFIAAGKPRSVALTEISTFWEVRSRQDTDPLLHPVDAQFLADFIDVESNQSRVTRIFFPDGHDDVRGIEVVQVSSTRLVRQSPLNRRWRVAPRSLHRF